MMFLQYPIINIEVNIWNPNLILLGSDTLSSIIPIIAKGKAIKGK